MVPVTVAKIKRLGPEVTPFDTTKPEVELNRLPVGTATKGSAAGPGICTTNGVCTPAPSYSVDTFVSASETQKGVLGPCDNPHASRRANRCVSRGLGQRSYNSSTAADAV